MNFYHYSEKPISLEGIRDSAQTHEEPAFKPKGIWLSVGDEWAKWVKEETSWAETRGALNHKADVILKCDANILWITNEQELRDFHAARGKIHPIIRSQYINWQSISLDYDGIVIAPYVWECRMDVGWYYPWDVASACIWRKRAIRDVLPVMEVDNEVDNARMN